MSLSPIGRCLDDLIHRTAPGVTGAPAAPPAEITIGTTVIVPHPERFGANVDVRDYVPWSLNSGAFNNLTGDGGMEPVILRYKGSATGGSATTIENNAGATTSAEETIADGFFDDAEVRVYRVVDGQVCLLRTNRVTRYLASAASGYAIILDREGPPVQAGDIYFLTLIRDNAPVDKVHPRLADLATADTWQIWGDRARVTTHRDASTVAPAYGSRTSLRITNTSDREGGIVQAIAGDPIQNVFNAFDPRRTYRVTLWLKQEGVLGSAVEVSLSSSRKTIRHTFTVIRDWARYQFTFKGLRHLTGADMAHLCITFQGPGTLWADDVHISDRRYPPYALRSQVVRSITDYQPGTLRIWSGQTNIAWGTTLDNWLAPEGQGMRFWEPQHGPVPGALFSLPTALALARATGSIPWLIVHLSFDEQEWRNLIEYLAGPPTSPYGARRAAQGQVRPWTDVFRTIRIEYGNEAWNSAFHPWFFDSGTEYGQFATYFFGVARTSPFYTEVARRFEFIIGGWALSTGPHGYGARARQAGSSSTIAVITYLRGWPRFPTPGRTLAERLQNTLLFPPWVARYIIDQQVATLRLLGKMGFPTSLVMSESGPGYRNPVPARAYDPAYELSGKSLAAGVSTLDAFLYNAAQGVGAQAYFAWGVGHRWTSHTAWNAGYRPHPAWLALQMRNRYAAGALVTTRLSGAEHLTLPSINSAKVADEMNTAYHIPAQTDVAMLATYAFCQGNRYAIFVLSRQVARPTPVTLHLPAPPVTATLYTLTGAPQAHNLTGSRLAIRRRTLRHVTMDYTFILPPSSIYLFVVDIA